MSSASNVTDPSSVPEENTPSFFRRAYNAYGAALAELLASPSSSPRRTGRPPDPVEVDYGSNPHVTHRARRPPTEIEVETVYTVESAPVNPSFNDGAPVVSGSSGHHSPISLFGQASYDNGHLNHAPTESSPRDAFAFASPRDPNVSPIPPNTSRHHQTPAPADSYVYGFTNAVPSTSRENPAQPHLLPSAPSLSNNINVASNHARPTSAFDQLQPPPQPFHHAAPSPTAAPVAADTSRVPPISRGLPVGSPPINPSLFSPLRPATAIHPPEQQVTWEPTAVVQVPAFGPAVPPNHALSSGVPHQAPPPLQTPWSVSALDLR